MLSCFGHVQFFCDPIDCSQPGSSLHGILPEIILETVAMPSSGDLYDASTDTHTQTHTHTLTHTETALCEPACYLASVVLNSLQTLGLFPPGSSLHGILQERTLERVTMTSSRNLYDAPTHTHTQTHTHRHTHILLFVSLRTAMLQWYSTLCRS